MRRSKILFIISIITGCVSVQAQDLNGSPYTRYGLGDYITPMSTPYTGLGGASIALANYQHVNFSNPATYGTVIRYNPIFDAGIMGKTSIQKTADASFTKTTVSLRDFSLLMPISPKTGFAFGLMPYTTQGYDINKFDPNDGDTITHNFSGTGSINRLFFGLGQQIFNRGDSVRLSVGGNASFLFGTLERDRSVLFEDVSYYNTRLIDKTIVRGFVFDLGIHYHEKLSKNLSYQLGATLNMGREVTGYRDTYAYNFKYSTSTLSEIEKDTTLTIEDSKGKIYIPRGVGLAAAVTIKNKVTLTAQYEFKNWQNYYEWFDSTEVNPDELRQSFKISGGIEYIPFEGMSTKNVSAFKLSTYRMGFNYGNAPYYLFDTQLKQYGISFGMSIPLVSSASTSSVSFGLEMGKMGTTENGLIEDNYFKFNIGFSLSSNARFDRWFRKRLYD